VTLLMMTAVIWCCVFNLFWAESCRVFAFSGMLLVTFFIQSLQTFLILVTFCYFFWTFFTSMLQSVHFNDDDDDDDDDNDDDDDDVGHWSCAMGHYGSLFQWVTVCLRARTQLLYGP